MKWRIAQTAGAALNMVAAVQAQQVSATLWYQLSFTEVLTGTTNPGNGNGLIEPGESARFELDVLITPPVGTVVSVDPTVIPAGFGTLRGMFWTWLDLVGSGGATGSWSHVLVAEHWDVQMPGTATSGGTTVANIGAGQFPPTQSHVTTLNPILGLWTGTWTPASYQARTVWWATAHAGANPYSYSSSAIVQDGVNPQVYAGSIATSHTLLQVPIVPTPGGVAVLGVGAVLARRRARRATGVGAVGRNDPEGGGT